MGTSRVGVYMMWMNRGWTKVSLCIYQPTPVLEQKLKAKPVLI